MTPIPPLAERAAWFNQARFGVFIHFGPYAVEGRGEQVLIRELLDPCEYERAACAWNPVRCDPRAWARSIAAAGAKYAVLTTRHHDGYCLWDSKLTNYTSARQASRRDIVREFVVACRAEGLRIGLYYSLADFRIPAYFEGPAANPAGWATFRDYVHGQVRELLTDYGQVDLFWFDGAWPRSSAEWGGPELLRAMRAMQPGILINNRLDGTTTVAGQSEQAGASAELGDFGTPEHHITAEAHRPWESCQVSTWRLWGFTRGERWRPADLLLDMLTDAASKGGNLLLNVGPDSQGAFPEPFEAQLCEIGRWMHLHGEAIYGSQGGDVVESVTYGRQIRRGNRLYLVFRFWPGTPTFRVVGLAGRAVSARLLSTGVGGTELGVRQSGPELVLEGLPETSPTPLLPVVRIDFDGPPSAIDEPLYTQRLWTGDASRYAGWARRRGEGLDACRWA
jgi:alpha-L-fucosidase